MGVSDGSIGVEMEGYAGGATDGGEEGGVGIGGREAVGHVEDVIDHFEGLRAEGEGGAADVRDCRALGRVEVESHFDAVGSGLRCEESLSNLGMGSYEWE